MSIVHLDNVSPSTNRLLAKRRFEAWSAAGKVLSAEVKQIFKEIQTSLLSGSSPAKAMNFSLQRMEYLLAKEDIRGSFHALNGRHINFNFGFLEEISDGLVFRLIQGDINSRSKSVNVTTSRPLHITLHSLQRLFERHDGRSDSAALDEIFSCIAALEAWSKAAIELGAKCWPVVSKSGFFVGACKDGTEVASLVTWMKADHLSKKWGLVFGSLEKLQMHRPDLLIDSSFAIEFIRSFPWMLYEHVPGEDLLALAWEHKADTEDDYDNQLIGSYRQSKNQDVHNGSSRKKVSATYVPGLNYKNERPPVKVQSQHSGVVVQKRKSGNLIVGLKNGWVGHVPSISIERGVELIPCYVPPDVGDEINVVVHKISLFESENAYAISLDPVEVSEASWKEIEQTNPIGRIDKAMILNKLNNEYLVSLPDGVRGVIPESDIDIYQHQPFRSNSHVGGYCIEVEVAGYRASRRCLLLSIPEVQIIKKSRRDFICSVGSEISGKCIGIRPVGALIQLENGVSGLLHKHSNWGRELPVIGEYVKVIVSDYNRENSQISFSGIMPNNIQKCFFPKVVNSDSWSNFVIDHPVGSSIDLQILYWRHNSDGYLVSTECGVVGLLPGIEISWGTTAYEQRSTTFQPGGIIQGKVKKINRDKKKVEFSVRELTVHPIHDLIEKANINLPLLCRVVQKVDFGYFADIQLYGVTGLLHRDQIIEGISIAVDEIIFLYVRSLSISKRRISFSMSPNISSVIIEE